MARIKIKTREPPDRDKKLRLVELLCTAQIQITKVHEAPDGFALILYNEDQADKIFESKIKTALGKDGFIPILPADMRVKNYVIVTRVDGIIFTRSEEEIKDEIVSKNSWINDDLDNVFKF